MINKIDIAFFVVTALLAAVLWVMTRLV